MGKGMCKKSSKLTQIPKTPDFLHLHTWEEGADGCDRGAEADAEDAGGEPLGDNRHDDRLGGAEIQAEVASRSCVEKKAPLPQKMHLLPRGRFRGLNGRAENEPKWLQNPRFRPPK